MQNRQLRRRKIKAVNPWRTPEISKEFDLHYESPHCQNGKCNYCMGIKRRKAAAATAALAATIAPGMFWDRKIFSGDEQLGPSAPDFWLETYVKPQG